MKTFSKIYYYLLIVFLILCNAYELPYTIIDTVVFTSATTYKAPFKINYNPLIVRFKLLLLLLFTLILDLIYTCLKRLKIGKFNVLHD